MPLEPAPIVAIEVAGKPSPVVPRVLSPVVSPVSVRDAAAVTIKGLCVAAETGGSLAGCLVRLTATGSIGVGSLAPSAYRSSR